MKKSIFSSILDEMIIFIFSAIALGIVEVVLRMFGWTMVAVGAAVYLMIIFFIANVLYYPLIENSKYGTTIGMRILKLDEVKKEEVEEDANDASNEEAQAVEETTVEETQEVAKEEVKSEEA